MMKGRILKETDNYCVEDGFVSYPSTVSLSIGDLDERSFREAFEKLELYDSQFDN